MLEDVIRKEALQYLLSDHWQGFVRELERGKEVRHAHIYVESILHPTSMAEVVRAYFEAAGRPLRRQIRFLSHGRGFGNVYNVHPEGMCHFEVMMRFSDRIVVEPMAPEATRKGRNAEWWDDDFMQEFYRKFSFRPMGERERADVKAYFESEAWKLGYACMAYEESNVHCHSVVEMSLHPEDVLPFGIEAIERRGWKVDRAVSVVFSVRGLDVGKITYLLSLPEIVLELEWEYNADVTIRPSVRPVARIISEEAVRRDLEGIPYVKLRRADVDWIAERLRMRA